MNVKPFDYKKFIDDEGNLKNTDKETTTDKKSSKYQLRIDQYKKFEYDHIFSVIHQLYETVDLIVYTKSHRVSYEDEKNPPIIHRCSRVNIRLPLNEDGITFFLIFNSRLVHRGAAGKRENITSPNTQKNFRTFMYVAKSFQDCRSTFENKFNMKPPSSTKASNEINETTTSINQATTRKSRSNQAYTVKQVPSRVTRSNQTNLSTYHVTQSDNSDEKGFDHVQEYRDFQQVDKKNFTMCHKLDHKCELCSTPEYKDCIGANDIIIDAYEEYKMLKKLKSKQPEMLSSEEKDRPLSYICGDLETHGWEIHKGVDLVSPKKYCDFDGDLQKLDKKAYWSNIENEGRCMTKLFDQVGRNLSILTPVWNRMENDFFHDLATIVKSIPGFQNAIHYHLLVLKNDSTKIVPEQYAHRDLKVQK